MIHLHKSKNPLDLEGNLLDHIEDPDYMDPEVQREILDGFCSTFGIDLTTA